MNYKHFVRDFARVVIGIFASCAILLLVGALTGGCSPVHGAPRLSLPPVVQNASNLDPYNQTAGVATVIGGNATPTLGNNGLPQPATYTTNGILDTLISSTNDLPGYALYRAVYVGTATSGNNHLDIQDWDGNTTVFQNVNAGTIYPIRPRRIMATSSNVSNIVGLR
jgi:hypothetical protein